MQRLGWSGFWSSKWTLVMMRKIVLKRQCNEIFWIFFISWIEAIWAPDKQSKMVLLKNSFSRRYLQKTWYCTESDSAQYHTAPSPTPRSITLRRVGKLKGLKIQNCLTLRGVRLCAVWYCPKSDSAQYHTEQSQTRRSITLRGVLLGTILSLQASPCLQWEY